MKISILFFGILIIASCGNSSSEEGLKVFFPEFEKVSITGEVVSEIISQTPIDLVLIDSTLLFFRPGGCAAKAYSIQGEDLGVVWHTGRGPNEFIGLYFGGQKYIDSTLYVYDLTTRMLRKYKWLKETGRLKFTLLEHRQQSMEYPLTNTQMLENGLFVSRAILDAGKQTKGNILILHDQDLNFIRSFCNPLNQEFEGLSLFQGRLQASGNRIVFATYQFGGYIVCYDIDASGNVSRRWERMLTSPEYETVPQFRINIEKNRDGFIDLCMTSKYIYALYDGELYTGGIKYQKDLLVFDHSGNPVAQLVLDRGCSRFTVTPDDSTIYTFSPPQSLIVKYNLSEILPR